MAGKRIATEKPRKVPASLKLKEPELFARLMAEAARRKTYHITLSGVARYALEQWITGSH